MAGTERSSFSSSLPPFSWRMMSMLSSSSPSGSIDQPQPQSQPQIPTPLLNGNQKYGTPVGVVILPNPSIQPFKTAIRNASVPGLTEDQPIAFRGVDPHTVEGYKQIHVSTEVAASLMDGNAYLEEFLKECGGVFISGARRKKGRRGGRGSGRQSLYRDNEGDDISTSASSTDLDESERASPLFTFVELFAGIGGFRIGLERIGGACVLASEHDPIACRIYRRHFDNKQVSTSTSVNENESDKGNTNQEIWNGNRHHLLECDMLDVVSDDFPPEGFDILTAGFPCQPFSARGEQKGLNDDGHRGQLYQELVRTLMEQRPPFFLFENVVGLVTMEGGHRHADRDSEFAKPPIDGKHTFKSGKVMERILDAFCGCGYKVEWKVVNSGRFVSQYRERVYFVGSLTELNCPDMEWDNIYPPEEEKPPILRDVLEQDYAQSKAVAESEITLQQWEKLQLIHHGEAETRARLKVEDYAPTLISSYRIPASPATRFVMEEADGTLRHGDPLRPRFLTTREFRDIMGFPDDFDVSAPYNNELGHIYQGLGNAVVPPVIEGIGREMLRLMKLVKQQ